MITLYQFPSAWGLPNVSTFCLKLETYLRMAQVEYEVATDADLRQAPKGKLPYIVDHRQSKTIADSNLILDYLRQAYGIDLDRELSPVDQAISLGMRRLVEENLYWVLLYSRWIEDDNWPHIKALFFGDVPWLLRSTIANKIRKDITRNLHGHGMGRHSPTEIYQIGITDLNALSTFLDCKPYFMGEQPTSLDAVAYGTLANLLRVPLDSPLKRHAETLDNLVTYYERMQARYFPG